MRNWLNGKWIVLSGASGGIGRELTKLLILKYGAKVLGIGRSEQKMLSLKKELGHNSDKFEFKLFDVGDYNGWLDFKDYLIENKIEPILLINNAGAFPSFNTVLKSEIDVFEKIMQTNYFASVYAVDVISPLLKGTLNKKGKKKDLPAIFNIASAASLCTVVGTSAYSASKAALKGYTEALQMEEKGKFYVGVAYPGTTATDLFRFDENTKNSALDYVAMPAYKMASKIARKIIKKRKRSILGWDAKLMNFTAKFMPVKGLFIIRFVMKISKSKVFSNVFDYAPKKDEKR